jgi:hypothetical protein
MTFEQIPLQRWRQRLERWKREGAACWQWGAYPGQPGCKAPPDLLKEFGFEAPKEEGPARSNGGSHRAAPQREHANGHANTESLYQDAVGRLRESLGAGEQPSEAAEPLIKTLTAFLDQHVKPEYVVDGILKRGFLYALTAMTGAGKTAIALLLAEIASNTKRRRKFGPHDVAHVRVVYIACENADDVRERLIGMEAKMEFDRKDLAMLVIDKVFDLEMNFDRIIKEVDAFGGNVGLVFIDTSAAMFQGDDDNSNTQMLDHAKSQRKLCQLLSGRPCVLSLMHLVKHVDGPDKLLPRGGGAYINEIDGNLTAWSPSDRRSRLHWTGKFRGPDFEPIEFRLPVIYTTALVDAKGRAMPTVMAEFLTDDAIADDEEKVAFQNNRLLLAIADRPDGSIAQWAQDCGWMTTAKPGEDPKPYKSLVQRVLKRLTQDKRLKKEGSGYTLTASGKKAVQLAKKGASKQGEQAEK